MGIHSEWIEVKLREHNNDTLAVYALYPEFVRKFDVLDYKISTYKRKVRKVLSKMTTIKKMVKNSSNTRERKRVLAEIDNRTKATGEKVELAQLEEIAKELGYKSADDIFDILPDVHVYIERAFRLNANHIDDRLKTHKLENEVSLLKAENKVLLDRHISLDSLMELLNDAVQVYKPLKRPTYDLKADRAERTAIAVISDVHWGETVSEEETRGLSVYNTEIALKRIDRLFEQIIENSVELGCDKLVVTLIGDIIDGIIQPDSLRNSDVHIVTGLLTIADYLSQHIVSLTSYFSEIEVIGLAGNHGRMLYAGKPNQKNYVEYNLDTLVYEFMKKELKDVVSDFKIPRSVFDVKEIYGKRIFLTHGHIMGSGGNGYQPIPNGISKNMSKFNALLRESNEEVDFAIIGHFHFTTEALAFDMTPVFVNGSIVGGDEFSIQALGRASSPNQRFFCLEKDAGELGIKYQTVMYLT